MVFSKCSRQFEQNFCVSEENWCTSCFNMKDYIQALTTELKSAQLIIKILQGELQSKRTEPTTTENLPTCVNYNPHVKNNNESVSESEWTEFRKNNHKSKLSKNTSRCLKQLTPHIPLGDNKFAPLSNLQDDTHQPTNVHHKSQPAQLPKTNCKNQRKVILLGDSHIRGCSEKLADLLGNSFRVIGITKPNANVKAVTDSINLKTEKLTRKDVVILCDGTRDTLKMRPI